MEGFFSTIYNFIKDNFSFTTWKCPSFSPTPFDDKMARDWELPITYSRFNNSKRIKRRNTTWKSPNLGYYKINFDEVERRGNAIVGRIIRSMIIMFTINVRGNSKN